MFEKYSGDESFALILGGAAGIVSWGKWFYELAVTGRGVRPPGRRWPLVLAPLVCALVLFQVLSHFSAEDVRTDAAYILFYMVLGAAWVGLYRAQLPLFGLSARDDVLERGNASTMAAFIGALVGGTCCFAGANVGNGPGWWVVLISALPSTISLLVLWWIVHLGSGLSEKVTLERDPAAGLRAGGFFIGAGLMLGRAVAGDWVSTSAMLSDFAWRAWPALVLAGAVIAVERGCSSNLARSSGACVSLGLLPAIVYVAAGVVVAGVL